VGEKQGFVEQEVKKILLVTDFLHFFGRRNTRQKPEEFYLPRTGERTAFSAEKNITAV
jgi:hypothetical protein